MKPHAWTLWLVVGLLGAVGAMVVSRGWAEETHQVERKPDPVIKNADIDKDDEEIVSPESVLFGEGKFKIKTKTFKPPNGWLFIAWMGPHPVDNPGYFVDIEIDPECLPPKVEAPTVTVPQDSVDAIKVEVTELTLPPTAGNFPLKCEGNLERSGGGGGGGKDVWHWSARVASREAKVLLAFTFDDGPHLLLDGKTVAIINTLKQKETQYNKPIKATFFVEHSRITPALGKTILKDHMTANDHEIACHGADPEVHHRKHQDTPDLPAKFTAMKGVISSAEAGGQTASDVRPPGGWAGWTQGTEYNKTQLNEIYENADLRRYTGEGTDGVNSWGIEYPSSGNTPPSPAARAAFIKGITDVIDEAWAAAGEAEDRKATKKLVILMHDLRTPDKDDIGPIIDEVETYAANKGVKTEYKRVKDF